MKKINLTNSNKCALVDDQFYSYLNQWNWTLNSNGYAFRVERYGPRSENKQKQIYMHRLIMNPFFIDGIEIDHASGDRLDNQKSNLRRCSKAQNKMNSSKSSGCSSKYKGVHWSKKDEKWVAQIGLNGKRVHIGYYRTEKEAAKSYDKEAIKHFGEFANPNFREAVKE